MRVRITERRSGNVDGIDLAQFEPGRVYDVHSALGCYLMALGGALPVSDAVPALVVPLERHGAEQMRTDPPTELSPTERSAAADRPRRRRK